MLGREQRGIIDKIRRGEIEKPDDLSKEIIQERDNFVITDEEAKRRAEESKEGPPDSKLNLKQSASVEVVRKEDRDD